MGKKKDDKGWFGFFFRFSEEEIWSVAMLRLYPLKKRPFFKKREKVGNLVFFFFFFFVFLFFFFVLFFVKELLLFSTKMSADFLCGFFF